MACVRLVSLASRARAPAFRRSAAVLDRRALLSPLSVSSIPFPPSSPFLSRFSTDPKTEFVGEPGHVSGSKPPPKIDVIDAIEGIPVSAEVEKLVDGVSKLNMIETMAFVHCLSKKLGLPWESVLNMGSGGGGGGGGQAQQQAAPAAEEEEKAPEAVAKTEFAVRLNELEDGKKYAVLKEVRNLKPGMTIAESKKFVEDLPSVLIDSIDKEEGAKWIKALEAAGGKAELV